MGASTWASTSTWTYSSTLANNTFGSAFSGSTSGLVSVVLGTSGQASHWQVNKVGSNNTEFGLNNETDSKTYDETNTNVPTGGTFMAVTPTVDVNFQVIWRAFNNSNIYIVSGSTNEKKTLGREKKLTTTDCGKLTAGTTYYIYGDETYTNSGNTYDTEFSFQGFRATTFTTYTINYTYNNITIKSEADIEGYEGQTVSASYTSVWDNENTTKYYVADGAATSFTVADGTNTFEVALRLAATDAVATVNAVDAEGTVLKSFTATGIEGETSGNIFYTRVVKYNDKYYAVPASNKTSVNYAKSGVVFGGSPVSVEYSLDNTIAYYAEIEDMEANGGFRGDEAVKERASGGDWHRLSANAYRYSPSGELSSGVYSIELCGRNQGSSTQSIAIKIRSSEGVLGDAVSTLSWETSSGAIHDDVVSNILVPSGSSIAVCEPSGYTSNIALDYVIIRKLYDVTDASKIIGAVDYSTGFMGAATESLALAQGKKVTYTFKNHGSGVNNYNKWAFEMSGTYNDNNSVYTWCGGSHVWVTTDAGNANTTSVTTDGAAMDWTTHNAEMKDGDVTLTAYYYDNGIFTVKSTDIGAAHTYNTWFAFNNAQSGNINVRLGVDGAWLEMVSSTTGEDAATVDVTIGSAGWATLYTPTAVNFAESGLTAYTATCDGSTVTLTEVGNVPANTGVVLKGATGTYNLPVATSSTTAQGSLQGSIAGATFYDENINRYMLALNSSNEAQFTKLGSGFITAGKAFLVVSSGARSLKVVFADESTGIKSIEDSRMATDNYYNLHGQCVSTPTKGLYIINGKKVIMK